MTVMHSPLALNSCLVPRCCQNYLWLLWLQWWWAGRRCKWSSRSLPRQLLRVWMMQVSCTILLAVRSSSSPASDPQQSEPPLFLGSWRFLTAATNNTEHFFIAQSFFLCWELVNAEEMVSMCAFCTLLTVPLCKKTYGRTCTKYKPSDFHAWFWSDSEDFIQEEKKNKKLPNSSRSFL